MTPVIPRKRGPSGAKTLPQVAVALTGVWLTMYGFIDLIGISYRIAAATGIAIGILVIVLAMVGMRE